MIIDTHAHINIPEFASKIPLILKRAEELGVRKIIAIGMDYKSNLRAIELANQFESVFATVGVHPSFYKDEFLKLEPLLKANKVVAIGECGIDLYHRQDNLKEQSTLFQKQIELAIKYQLPLVIHVRNSFNEVYRVLEPYKGKVFGVFHCFSDDLVAANKVIELGFMIGIGGAVTFSSAVMLHEIVRKIDIKHMVVETDSPYVTPAPYRGQRNEPANTSFVVREIAKLRSVTIEEVAKITSQNAIKLFNLR